MDMVSIVHLLVVVVIGLVGARMAVVALEVPGVGSNPGVALPVDVGSNPMVVVVSMVLDHVVPTSITNSVLGHNHKPNKQVSQAIQLLTHFA